MQSGGLSAFVQRRWGTWGIFVLGLWALILALVAFARLVFLSALVTANVQENIGQGRIWTVFILNVLLGLAFAACAYGLWTRRHWGRFLFMGCIIVWSFFYVTALFVSGPPSADNNFTVSTLTFNLIPYIIGAVVSVWYLNLPHIKALFDRKQSTDSP
jgi:hypothetical protein